MIPPTKDQSDIGIENVLLDASASATNKDTARQEFKDEADINYMLSRFGITQPRGTPTYGTWDETLDLQVAIQSVREARTAYADLPKVLRDKFTSMDHLLTAVENGSLVLKDEDAPAPAKTPHDLMLERLAKLENPVTPMVPPVTPIGP